MTNSPQNGAAIQPVVDVVSHTYGMYLFQYGKFLELYSPQVTLHVSL